MTHDEAMMILVESWAADDKELKNKIEQLVQDHGLMRVSSMVSQICEEAAKPIWVSLCNGK